MANDECDGAIAITPGTGCTPQTFNNGCASQSLPAVECGTIAGEANDDVWYSFTATNSNMSIGVLPSADGNMNPVIEIFTGGCGSLVSFDCSDDGGQSEQEDLQTTGLSVGTMYYFRVYDYRLQYSIIDASYELCVVEGLGSGVGVAEMSSSSTNIVYPNPTNGNFNIHVDPRATSVVITVLDASGRSVHQRTERAMSSGTIAMELAGSMNSGIYLLRVVDEHSVQEHRVVVQE